MKDCGPEGQGMYVVSEAGNQLRLDLPSIAERNRSSMLSTSA
jgi:hypothetical protein